MTRWARKTSAHRTVKQPEEATSWSEFQSQREKVDKPSQQKEDVQKGIHRAPDKTKRITDEERRKIKKAKTLKRMREEREKKGMVLLPEKIEKKIYRMKKGMRAKGKSEEEIRQEIRAFRRKEELGFRKEVAKACFHCRQPGHQVADCPEAASKTGICYKCGSGDHTSAKCLKASKEGFKFASCFVCGKEGHISRECPDNEKGQFPKGGGCRFCGSNRHKKQDCPNRKVNQETNEHGDEVVAHVIDDVKTNVDVQDFKTSEKQKSSKAKVVKF